MDTVKGAVKQSSEYINGRIYRLSGEQLVEFIMRYGIKRKTPTEAQVAARKANAAKARLVLTDAKTSKTINTL